MTRLSNADKHALLIDGGWSTRVDGRLRPPATHTDQRARTLTAAWADHTERTDNR